MREGIREQILGQLATSRGHLGAIHRMVAEEASLLETIRQVQAVQSALRNVEGLLLREALSRCLESRRRRPPGEIAEELAKVLAHRAAPRRRN